MATAVRGIKNSCVVGVRLPESVAEALAKKAEEDDRSPSGYVRKMILDRLANEAPSKK